MAGIASVGRQFELAPTWAASLMIPRKEYGGAVTTRKPIREMGRASHHHNDFIGDARSQNPQVKCAVPPRHYPKDAPAHLLGPPLFMLPTCIPSSMPCPSRQHRGLTTQSVHVA